MSFIGRQLADGAWAGFLNRIDEFVAYLDDQPLPPGTRENYQRITTSALRAVNCLINKGKAHFTSHRFSKDIEKITTRALRGVGSATGKYFKTGTKASSSKKQQAANPLLGFMTQAQSLFSDIGNIAQKELKKQLLSFFSEWIFNGLDIALTSFKSDSSDYKTLKGTVEEAKKVIQDACQTGELNRILIALKDLSKAVEDAPLYFNGIPLLSTTGLEDSGLVKGIANAKLLTELTRIQASKEKEPLRTIKSELKSLAKNLAIQNTLNIIFTNILNLPIPSSENIFAIPRLRVAIKQLSGLINASSASPIRKLLAHISTSIIMHFFYYVLDYAFDQLEKKINTFVYTKVDERLNFSKIASLFGKLNASHLTIKDKKDYFGTIDQIVVKNMETHQANPSSDLYQKVQTKFLNEFSLKLPVTKLVWQKIWDVQFNHSFLNAIFFPLKLSLCVFSWLTFIIPEQILNFILSYTLKISFFWKKTLPNLILKALTSFSDYTQSVHPINLMMVDHLQKIWDELKSTYIDHEQPTDHTKKLAPETKESLDLTLKHLFELLEKTPFDTPEQLMHYLEGHSPIENAKIIASRFFLSQNLSAFTNMIAQAIKIAISKESKEKLITQALININQGFSKKQGLTLKEMIETEEKINIMLSQILSLTIRKTIETRYNFTPKNQIVITDRFLNEIKQETSKECKKWLITLDQLTSAGDIGTILDNIHAFCEFMQNKQLEIRSNQELPKNPRALINQRYCEPIQEQLALIIHSVKNVAFLKDLHTDANFLIRKLEMIAKTSSFELKDILEFQQQAWLIQRSLPSPHPLDAFFKPFYNKLEEHLLIQKIKSDVLDLNHCQDHPEFLKHLAQINPSAGSFSTILDKLKLEAKNLAFVELKSKIMQVNQELETTLKLCNIGITEAAIKLTTHLTSKKDPVFGPKSKQQAWDKAKVELKHHIEELQKLCAGFAPIKHYNIKLISTGDMLELMQNFAYNSIIGPTEQLLKLIKKPYIWQYGIVNPLCQEFLE